MSQRAAAARRFHIFFCFTRRPFVFPRRRLQDKDTPLHEAIFNNEPASVRLLFAHERVDLTVVDRVSSLLPRPPPLAAHFPFLSSERCSKLFCARAAAFVFLSFFWRCMCSVRSSSKLEKANFLRFFFGTRNDARFDIRFCRIDALTRFCSFCAHFSFGAKLRSLPFLFLR